MPARRSVSSGVLQSIRKPVTVPKGDQRRIELVIELGLPLARNLMGWDPEVSCDRPVDAY
jgi:hypothetical protein